MKNIIKLFVLLVISKLLIGQHCRYVIEPDCDDEDRLSLFGRNHRSRRQKGQKGNKGEPGTNGNSCQMGRIEDVAAVAELCRRFTGG